MLKNYNIPENTYILDAGTGIRDVLFDIILSEKKPKKIIIVDAINAENKKPGEVFKIKVDDLPENKIDDFSIHQIPTSNLLKELEKFSNINIILIVVQIEFIPDEVKPGDVFSAYIMIEDVTDFVAGQFDLSFDSDVITVVDVKNGEIESQDVPILAWNFKPGSNNYIRAVCDLPGADGVSGSGYLAEIIFCLLYTSPSPRDLSTSRMPSSA